MEDSAIIELYWNRSETAISRTAEKYSSYCRRISMNILNNCEDADECVNDTYLHAWNAIPPNRPSVLRTWLGRITRNLSLDRYRKSRMQKRGCNEIELLFSELESCIPDTGSIGKSMEDSEIAQLISAFLKNNTEDNRLVFLRRYYYGDSILQIAERFEMSESKVKSILFRTRKVLKTYLEKEGVTI
ncbi:MAG TPA: RNA polymerase sigma factor [Clostridia bacterium]|nr:RNA polymerase sigma factor [Clostridia bacterium]